MSAPMARLVSFVKSNRSKHNQQPEPSASRDGPIRRFWSKTREVFRRKEYVEPQTPAISLVIPTLPENIGSLQVEIDEGLLFLSHMSDASHGETWSTHSPDTDADTPYERFNRSTSSDNNFAQVTNAWLPAGDVADNLASSIPSTSEFQAPTSISNRVSTSLPADRGDGSHDGVPFSSEVLSVSNDAAALGGQDATQAIVERSFNASESDTSIPSRPEYEPESMGLSLLFEERDLADGVEPKKDAREDMETGIEVNPRHDRIYIAQSASEIDAIRRRRPQLAEVLQELLASQKADLESRFQSKLAEQERRLGDLFEERYDSSAKLHDIELLNLKDDHDAEVKELKGVMTDLRARLARNEKSTRTPKERIDSLEHHCNDAERQLRGQFSRNRQLLDMLQERETTSMQQNTELLAVRKDLSKTRQEHEIWAHRSQREKKDLVWENQKLADRGTALREEFNHSQRVRESLKLENRKLEDRNAALCNELNQMSLGRQAHDGELQALRARLRASEDVARRSEQSHEDLRIRLDAVVVEKTRDYSWHLANDSNTLSMRPMHTEDEIASATGALRGKLQEKAVALDQLNDELDTVRRANKAKFKKMKRVISNMSQEIVILEMALSTAQGQRDHWAKEYDTIAGVVASNISFRSYIRGLVERLNLLQRASISQGKQMLEAELRGDRAVLELAICKKHRGIKAAKRDSEIASLKQQLCAMTVKFEHEEGMAIMFKDDVESKMPRLQRRNDEVEKILNDQLRNNVQADHMSVVDDMVQRVHFLEDRNRFWENQTQQQYLELCMIRTDHDCFSGAVFADLTSAHLWRDERDSLVVENKVLRERFADELRNDPLIVPKSALTRTSKSSEEQFSLDRIDDALLKHYQFTWSAVPKAILLPDCNPWEYMRTELGEDIAALRNKWYDERDALLKSFRDEQPQMLDDREWVQNPNELEATRETAEIGSMSSPGLQDRVENQEEKVEGEVEGEDPCADFF